MSSRLLQSSEESRTMAVRDQWEVEFSRFFNFPPRSVRSPSLPGLKPLPKCKSLSNGTWIAAESAAILSLLDADAAPVISVSFSFSGTVLEEHFVSNLQLSWPQVSCASQCPIRGSRVVFFSYRDCSSQIQKFAVRFPTCVNAESFFNLVKECSRDTLDIGPPGSDFVCENSSPSEFNASNGLHYRVDEESSYGEPIASYGPEMPALTFNSEQHECALQPLLSNNIDTLFSGFPPSFTELLTSCSASVEKEAKKEIEEADLTTQNVGCMLDSSFNDATEQPKLFEEADLKNQIAKYMSDASFHDMLFKIEKVINDLGGDLAL